MAVALGTAAAILGGGALAGAATGSLTYRECITGDEDAACREIPAATPGGFGEESGLDNLQSVAVSRDGKSVYAASDGDSAVSRFKRNRRTGALTYKGCITGETESGPTGSGACTEIPVATSSGSDSGLDDLEAVILSADGKSLYTASSDDAAVARFKRNRRTGALTYKGCITGETESGPGGTGACGEISNATLDGSDSGLADLRSLILSADGESLYAGSSDDAAVARFKRNPRTGKLAYKGCITGDEDAACGEIPGATAGGFGEASGLDNISALAISGKALYASSSSDDAIARFKRNPRTGALTYKGCITGETESGPTGTGACQAIPSATPSGSDSGLGDPRSLAVSASALYASSNEDAAIARFKRNPRTGKLAYKGCITGDEDAACRKIPAATAGGFGEDSGLDDLRSLALIGRSLYAASGGDDAVSRFKRRRRTGALTYKGCITGETESGPTGTGACRAIPGAAPDGENSGLHDLEALTLSRDGSSLYTASGDDAAVARFKRAR